VFWFCGSVVALIFFNFQLPAIPSPFSLLPIFFLQPSASRLPSPDPENIDAFGGITYATIESKNKRLLLMTLPRA